MIEIEIPGYKNLSLSNIVLDYNGSLACDGKLIEGVGERLEQLSKCLGIHVLTADTFGAAGKEIAGLPCRSFIIPRGNEAAAKADFVRRLGADGCVAIGNGRNDRAMLKEAALGIAVVQAEGAATEAILAADVVSLRITDALDLLVYPLRLTATLRS